jgi:hypothetical protein
MRPPVAVELIRDEPGEVGAGEYPAALRGGAVLDPVGPGGRPVLEVGGADDGPIERALAKDRLQRYQNARRGSSSRTPGERATTRATPVLSIAATRARAASE